MNSKGGKKAGSWLIRIIFFLSIIALAFIIFSLSKETYKKRQVEKEIETLRQEAEKIKRDNLILEDKVSYLESKDYQEKEAKDKLNMQSPDENVVVIKPGMAKKEDSAEIKNNSKEPSENGGKLDNIRRWYDYFFK